MNYNQQDELYDLERERDRALDELSRIRTDHTLAERQVALAGEAVTKAQARLHDARQVSAKLRKALSASEQRLRAALDALDGFPSVFEGDSQANGNTIHGKPSA